MVLGFARVCYGSKGVYVPEILVADFEDINISVSIKIILTLQVTGRTQDVKNLPREQKYADLITNFET